MRAKLQVKLLTAQQEKVMARAAAEVEQVNARAAEQARAFALYVARASFLQKRKEKTRQQVSRQLSGSRTRSI